MTQIDYNKNALDVFRVLGTLQVFFGHIITHYHMTNPPVDLVYFVRGVPILFVLCGFLAAKALDKYSAKEWLIGRAARILPGFWACIVVNTVIIAVVYTTKPSLMEAAVYGVTQFFGLNFYTGGWLRGYGVGTPNGVLWTIPVQIQFFILAPLFYKFLKKRSVRGSLVLVGILTVLSILLERSAAFLPEIATKLIGVTVLPYLYFLVAGMVGWHHRDTIIPVLQKKKWLILAAYVVWKLAEIYLPFTAVLNGVLYNALTTLLMAAVIFAFAFGKSWRMPRDYTFGFYLYHMVFINLTVHFGFRSLEPAWCGVLLIAAVAVATTVCAWLSQKFVENPAAKLLNKRRVHHG